MQCVYGKSLMSLCHFVIVTIFEGRLLKTTSCENRSQLLLKIAPIGVPIFGSARRMSYLCGVKTHTTLAGRYYILNKDTQGRILIPIESLT